MKKISELIGTGDLFAEIVKIKNFSAFSGMDTKDLTAFFVCQQGEKCCTDSVSAMTLEQVAKLIVFTRGEIIDNLTTYHGKFSENLTKSGSAVTVHTQTNSGTNDSLQKVVPNNLTEIIRYSEEYFARDMLAEYWPYIDYAIKTSKGKEMVVLLMHDTYGKEETAKALPSIIKYFKDNGYEFKTLS